MDAVDRRIINRMQEGFPICACPFAKIAREIDLDEADLMRRLQRLLDAGTLTRFGPMYNVERFGGAYSLCAMKVPQEELEHVSAITNSYPAVAHNYARDHAFSLWFVLAADQPDQVERVIAEIERRTGHRVYNLPKLQEFYVGAQFRA